MAERVPAKVSRDFIPTHSQRLANDIHLEPYGSTNHILSILEGMWSVVDRKAGGLAVARHIQHTCNLQPNLFSPGGGRILHGKTPVVLSIIFFQIVVTHRCHKNSVFDIEKNIFH